MFSGAARKVVARMSTARKTGCARGIAIEYMRAQHENAYAILLRRPWWFGCSVFVVAICALLYVLRIMNTKEGSSLKSFVHTEFALDTK